MFRQVEPMTVLASVKALTLKLWDESMKKLVSLRQARKARKEQQARDREKHKQERRKGGTELREDPGL
jgi:hypothetical protein